MDKKIAYFVKRIEYALHTDNYIEAQMYYNKAISYVGETSEIVTFKMAIDNGIKKVKPVEQETTETAEIPKRKTINEKAIILPIALVGIVGYLIYFFISVYPVNHLKKAFDYDTWYQGTVDQGWGSEGSYLECGKSEGNQFTISYRQAGSNTLIARFECEVVNGSEILVEGQPTQVYIEDDYITFSPSFVDVSDRSVWRSNRDYEDDDKTGNFSDDQLYNNNITDGYSSDEDTNSSSSAEPDESAQNNTSTPSKNNSTSKPSSTTQTTSKPASSTPPSSKPSTSNTTSSKPSSSSATSSKPSNSSQNNSSTPSKNNSSKTSKPSSSTQTTSKPTVAKDPCADGHSWKDATCTSPATCVTCHKTSGNAKGHSWNEATCSAPKKCQICKTTEGSALPHDMNYTKCTVCDHTDFSNYTLNSNTFCLDSWFYLGNGSKSQYLEDGEASISIDKNGICKVKFDKYSYTFTLVQSEYDAYGLHFECYMNGEYIKNTEVTFYFSQNRCDFFNYGGTLGFSQVALNFDM